MTSLHERNPKLPMGQLVGGNNERYVRYAETNKPVMAKAIMIQNKAASIHWHSRSVILCEELKCVVQTEI